ncbi:MAG TPA: hypothetical protein VHL53_00965 [Acidimicrobiia bacterium]|nr:hypothetical protein [Acidimicrobiia bacterium]
MGSEGLPVTLRRFVLNTFDTISAVEVLLFLYHQPARPWPVESVAQRLRLDDRQAAGILADLTARGLLRRGDQGFEYGPRAEDGAAVTMLADYYRRYRWRITGLVFSKEDAPGDGPLT